MEQSRKNLKIMSIALLVLAGLSFVRILLELFLHDYNVDSADRPYLLAGLIIIAAISFLILLPQVYCGIKGFNVSKNPDSSKGHIVWAIILLVISAIAVVAYLVEAIKTGEYRANFSVIIDNILDVCIYASFIQYAKQVRTNA
ncbi:MAG: hypothetical protein IKU25_02530 [Clostridia bacterium]|nr:hypothetical protein [Clostridia bacterium]